jgi:MFS family permease
MMIATDLGRGAFVASIAVLALLHSLPVWWIYVVGFGHSTLTICFEAGQFAAVPSLVGQENQEDLVTANGRIQASYSTAQILGPVLAGALVAFVPITSLTLFDGASFVVSAATLALIARSFNSEQPAVTQKNILRDVQEGLRYVFGHPVLRNISIMMALSNFIFTAAMAQQVLFVSVQFQASGTLIALTYSAQSAGTVVLALLAGPLRKRWSFSQVALTALAIDGLMMAVLAFLHLYWLALPVFALGAGLGIVFNINTSSLRQAIVPNALMGRVMTIAAVTAWSAIPLGAITGGLVVQSTHNVALLYAVCGGLQALLPIIFAFTPLGHAEKYLPQKSEKV